MTIKSDNIQIGANATATQNFVLKQGADGTCTLARGNVGATTQDVLTVDASGLVTLTQGKQLTLATAQATTSGTSIDFTGIPSWVKRITVMFNGVSTNGTSLIQVQIGSGAVSTSGYACSHTHMTAASLQQGTATSGFIIAGFISTAADTQQGNAFLSLLSSNIWTCSSNIYSTGYSGNQIQTGAVALGGSLDRVRLTTVNGTDTFDAGSVNIMYEG